MFYDYDKRMANLENIYKINNEDQKYECLKRFIIEEKQILATLNQPTFRSHALDSARNALRGYEYKISESISLSSS